MEVCLRVFFLAVDRLAFLVFHWFQNPLLVLNKVFKVAHKELPRIIHFDVVRIAVVDFVVILKLSQSRFNRRHSFPAVQLRNQEASSGQHEPKLVLFMLFVIHCVYFLEA